MPSQDEVTSIDLSFVMLGIWVIACLTLLRVLFDRERSSNQKSWFGKSETADGWKFNKLSYSTCKLIIVERFSGVLSYMKKPVPTRKRLHPLFTEKFYHYEKYGVNVSVPQ